MALGNNRQDQQPQQYQQHQDTRVVHGISFDRTISLGHVLTIMSIVGATVGGYVTYRLTIAEHATRLAALERQMLTEITSRSELSLMMYNIRQDVAVIRDRLERGAK